MGAFFLVLLIWVTALSSTVFALSPCADKILSADPQSAEFLRISVRDPAEPLFDAAYLGRLQASFQTVFIPWFTSPSPHLPVREMLRESHSILVSGRQGGEIYQGASGREHGQASAYIVVPGKFRDEICPADSKIDVGFRWDRHLSNDIDPTISSRVERYIASRPSDRASEPSSRWVFGFPFRSTEIEVLEIPRSEGKVYEWNEIFEGYFYHYYPKAADVPLYLKGMERVLLEVHQLYHSPLRFEAGSLDTLLHLLSEYVYLGVHGHVFNGANFSLVMGQANLLLALWGLEGIVQSNLDYVALSRSIERFESRFRRDVYSANVGDPRIRDLNAIQRHEANDPRILSLSHFAFAGDRLFGPGQTMRDDNTGNYSLEGFALTAKGFPDGVTVQYFAHLAGIGDTAWQPDGVFVGTRGESRAIEGVAIRLAGPRSSEYEILYQAMLKDRGASPVCRGGEFCGSRGESRPLTQVSIWVIKK